MEVPVCGKFRSIAPGALRRARREAARWLLAAGCLLLGGCVALVSDQQELALGQKYQQELAQQVQLDQNPMDLQYINGLGQRLASSAPSRPGMPLSFHIVLDDSLNAFAIPGGHVYVNTGSIKSSADESELAAVMAHEIGHVVAQHHKQTIARDMGVNLLNELVFGEQGAQGGAAAAQQLANLVAKGTMLHYSREQEYEADSVGLQILATAGYDPAGLTRFFAKLQAEGNGSPARITKFLSSHPLTPDRIARAQQIISAMGGPPNPQRDSPGFQAFRARFP